MLIVTNWYMIIDCNSRKYGGFKSIQEEAIIARMPPIRANETPIFTREFNFSNSP
nr:hypothetical protein [Candidatus Freyarchaeota archaeon]